MTSQADAMPEILDSTAIVKAEPQLITKRETFSRDQIDLIKRTVARGCTDDELALFLYSAKKRGLDPLVKQIYAIKRKTKNHDGSYSEVMTIQTGIDGFRAIATRTGQLAGSDDAAFTDDGKLPKTATVTVYRMVGGLRCAFSATARWDEYKQVKYSGELMGLWAKMPFTMLAKCAEALALRKAFPEDLSGIYTFDEMAQADSQPLSPAIVTRGRMDDNARLDYLSAIDAASDIDELKKHYTDACNAARAANDEDALRQIIDAKDERKKVLQ